MGNLSSHETVETLQQYQDPFNFESYEEWTAPIQNDDQFSQKWHRLIERRLELADNDVFRQVFDSVCKDKGEKDSWTQTTFIDFFSHTTRPLRTTPQDAALFYNLILKLGSYPYITPQNQIPKGVLNFLTFKTGLMVLSGRLTATPPNASGSKFTGNAGRKYRRVLFLALLDDEVLEPPLQEGTERTDDDDEDLLDVLKLFEAYRWEGPNLCMMYEGPEIPHRTAFRSSCSAPKGTVTAENVRQLLRLLLAVKLWQFEIDLVNLPVRDLDWAGVIDAVIASGGGGMTRQISWMEFNKMFATIPRAFEGLGPLLKPFVSPNPNISLQPESNTARHNQYTSHYLTTLPGTIFTLPLLSQILCSAWSDSLYTSHALNASDLATLNLEYSGPLSSFETALSKFSESTRLGKQAIILFSGTTEDTAESFLGGMYLNNNLDEFTTSFLFQLRPVNRSFSAHRVPGESEMAQALSGGMRSGGLMLETTVSGREGTGRYASMSLQLREGRLGAFAWNWDRESEGRVEFGVDLIEYISFGRNDT